MVLKQLTLQSCTSPALMRMQPRHFPSINFFRVLLREGETATIVCRCIRASDSGMDGKGCKYGVTVTVVTPGSNGEDFLVIWMGDADLKHKPENVMGVQHDMLTAVKREVEDGAVFVNIEAVYDVILRRTKWNLLVVSVLQQWRNGVWAFDMSFEPECKRQFIESGLPFLRVTSNAGMGLVNTGINTVFKHLDKGRVADMRGHASMYRRLRRIVEEHIDPPLRVQMRDYKGIVFEITAPNVSMEDERRGFTVEFPTDPVTKLVMTCVLAQHRLDIDVLDAYHRFEVGHGIVCKRRDELDVRIAEEKAAEAAAVQAAAKAAQAAAVQAAAVQAAAVQAAAVEAAAVQAAAVQAAAVDAGAVEAAAVQAAAVQAAAVDAGAVEAGAVEAGAVMDMTEAVGAHALQLRMDAGVDFKRAPISLQSCGMHLLKNLDY